ncbi:hypothetical protein ED312_06575 [Sinomicrobium pectinilyticum]|uniref:DUF6998 domain-containing protein n=1 Tax=Sinomicrobium pectinilyticum TaxID=1084421 RepID=A0A3N0EQA7_SINP1|nr:hypothetical protein [Sinomicrobium pectinilyticum]RNL90086.1 hypothetical protein ED312_06575 [Sinomicrobium pectinilyticum]
MKFRSELKAIADSLRTLRRDGIIRTKNLVGDLGEYYCQELLNIKLCKIVEKGFDGFDPDGLKVEIKTRRLPSNSAKVIFRGFDFDYCLFVELNEYFEPVRILKIPSEEIIFNLDKKGDRLSFKKLTTATKNIRLI